MTAIELGWIIAIALAANININISNSNSLGIAAASMTSGSSSNSRGVAVPVAITAKMAIIDAAHPTAYSVSRLAIRRRRAQTIPIVEIAVARCRRADGNNIIPGSVIISKRCLGSSSNITIDQGQTPGLEALLSGRLALVQVHKLDCHQNLHTAITLQL